MWKLDLKDKCIHKSIYDEIYTDLNIIFIHIQRKSERKNVIVIMSLRGIQRRQEKRE
jgi:hypothetical protein